MKYTLTEVTEIPPDGRKTRIPAKFYNDIIKVFIETKYPIARVEVPGVNPDGLARRLWARAENEGLSVISRGDGVYLRNDELIRYKRASDNPPQGGWKSQ